VPQQSSQKATSHRFKGGSQNQHDVLYLRRLKSDRLLACVPFQIPGSLEFPAVTDPSYGETFRKLVDENDSDATWVLYR
jgi:hypothetical protein